MANVNELAKQLGSSDQVKVYQAKQEMVLLTAEAGAPGKDRQRSDMAAEMAKCLATEKEQKDNKGKVSKVPELNAQARSLVCRYLANVGDQSEAAALERAMQDFDVREMARWALSRMTCQAATDALAKAAKTGIGDEFRVGAINALAGRSGSNVRETLVACAGSGSPQVRLAAIEALASDADPGNDAVLAKVAVGEGVRAGKRVAKARLRLAENLVAAGQKQAGRQIYQQIADGKYDRAQQKAAQAALKRIG
ncbi:MAG TPA: hypothetical protein VHY91_13460 [Pirellulales bacterium]|jgi:hypothetical protein|nr:hypothetical protein [Pirellulales bacterium]